MGRMLNRTHKRTVAERLPTLNGQRRVQVGGVEGCATLDCECALGQKCPIHLLIEALHLLEEAGAQVETVCLPHLEYALDAYYLIMPAEASSNLARYDGMRYGLRVEPAQGPVTAEAVMAATRGAGFGDEVKRRIILGTHVLSAGYYDAYYGSAQKVRTLVQRDFAAAWDEADVLVSPTAPVTAYRFGEKDDPLTMYKLDVTTIPANLAGVPAMSLPSGLVDGLPVGFQILAPQRADDRLYRVGAVLEAALEDRWGAPLLSQAPALPEAPGQSVVSEKEN